MSVQYCWLFIGGSSLESIGVLLNRPLAFRSFISSVVYSCANARTVANISTWARSSPGQGGRNGEREGESVERGLETESARERETVQGRGWPHGPGSKSGFANSQVLRPLAKLVVGSTPLSTHSSESDGPPGEGCGYVVPCNPAAGSFEPRPASREPDAVPPALWPRACALPARALPQTEASARISLPSDHDQAPCWATRHQA
jgi:hypothetical protein